MGAHEHEDPEPFDGRVVRPLAGRDAGEAVAEAAVLFVEAGQVNPELLDGGGQGPLDDPRRPQAEQRLADADGQPAARLQEQTDRGPIEGAVSGTF
jgi:hypothetical protein